MLRDWLRGAFRSGLAAAGLALFVASPLFGQASTGKIQGRVTDAATGAPIVGAQVAVDNTTLGNLTNDQGFYFINEVPAGLQNVRAQFIGYRPFVVEGQRILAGQTTTMNYELEATAVELEAITVEGERNPLVPRDQTTTKTIIQGSTIDQLPLDNTANIVLLSTGVVQTNRGLTIRGGRANEEAVFIDGVNVRSFGRGVSNNVLLPTNALEQVDVNIGAFSAEFGESQSGVVSLVTRSGGPRMTGSLELFTDQVTNTWRTNFNRAELTFGGPIAGPLTFFIAGTAQGQDQFKNEDALERWVIDGIDSCPSGDQYSGLCTAGEAAIFDVEKPGATTSGATDIVKIAAPNFVPFDNARVIPDRFTQQDLFTGNLNWQLPRGSRINFSYTRNRTQNFGLAGGGGGGTRCWRATPCAGFRFAFNPDDIMGQLATRNVFNLGWFQTLMQTADQQLALDVRLSYQTDRTTNGGLDQSWWQDNRDPFLGFSFSNIEFLIDADNARIQNLPVFDVTDEWINAYRSGAINRDSQSVYPQRQDLASRQSLTGTQRLRLNPYGLANRYDIAGNTGRGSGLFKVDEDRFVGRASLDWQIGRFNRVKLGGEYTDIDLAYNGINLYSGGFRDAILPQTAEPTRIGAFLQDRLDIGDLVLEGGIRFDYVDAGAEYPRVPGYVFNVPDSLQAGFVRYDGATGNYVDKWDVPCNGASVCKSNFIEGSTKSEWSPRLGASFPVTPTSTFRLSYGRFVQTPAFFTRGGFAQTTTVGFNQIGLLQSTNLDLVAGPNQNEIFGRDVDLPSTRQFEFGYRQLIGTDLVIDVSAFNKKQRSALSAREVTFDDPNNAVPTRLKVVTNADFTETNGFEVKVDKAIANLFSGTVAYTFMDARGSGSDPLSTTQLLLRGQSNAGILLGQGENPPDLLLPLEVARKHSIALATSLAFPIDYLPGSVAGAILRDFGWFMTFTVRSGLPFTKLLNTGEGQVGPPSLAGLVGTAQGSISNLTTTWDTRLNMRFTKGFQLGKSWNLQAFVDWRNPFNLENNNRVFIETGGTVNNTWYDKQVNRVLTSEGIPTAQDGGFVDFDIVGEITAPAFNDLDTYMMLRAEERFGNGNGVFTAEEQNDAFMSDSQNDRGQSEYFETSNQLLRLGFRVAF